MKIPFKWLPASWGLRGKSKEIARAEYELEGYDLDVQLANLKIDDEIDRRKALLDIDFKHGKIDAYTREVELAKIGKDGTDADLAVLAVDLKHDRITQQEHDRKRADLVGEPWMAMPKISWDPINPSKTYFELDYNDHFIGFLRDNDYQGTDEECINRWLNDVCLSVLDEMNQPDPEMVTPIRKIRLPDGKTEHS